VASISAPSKSNTTEPSTGCGAGSGSVAITIVVEFVIEAITGFVPKFHVCITEIVPPANTDATVVFA
jgi:hypothetical protein